MKKFWIFLFIVLIAANVLLYTISQDKKSEDVEREIEEGYTKLNLDNLMTAYYFIFAGVIIVAIAVIILTLVRRRMSTYY